MQNIELNKYTADKIVLTIDLEDWFHCMDANPNKWESYERRIEKSTITLLNLLKEKGSYATFFILGDVAKTNPDLVQQIVNNGHEIGSHSVEHKFIYSQTPSEFRFDLKHSLDLLTSITNQQIVSFRAPYFSITKNSLWAFDILLEEGIVFDSSVFPVRNHRYGIPEFQRLPLMLENGLFEFPISTYKSLLGNIPFSGGVYFRVYPNLLNKWFIKTLLSKAEPVLLYFHPWEFDPDQPIINSGNRFLNFRHYYNLKNNFDKLKTILSEYKTISLKTFWGNVNG